jgi:hypothetical protein
MKSRYARNDHPRRHYRPVLCGRWRNLDCPGNQECNKLCAVRLHSMGGVASLLVSVALLALYIYSSNADSQFVLPAVLISFGIVFLVAGIGCSISFSYTLQPRPSAGWTPAQLKQHAEEISERLQKFQDVWDAKTRDEDDAWMQQSVGTPSERTAVFLQRVAKNQQMDAQMKSEYKSTLWTDASNVYDELCVRLNEPPIKPGHPPKPPTDYVSMMDCVGSSEHSTSPNRSGIDVLEAVASKTERHLVITEGLWEVKEAAARFLGRASASEDFYSNWLFHHRSISKSSVCSDSNAKASNDIASDAIVRNTRRIFNSGALFSRESR